MMSNLTRLEGGEHPRIVDRCPVLLQHAGVLLFYCVQTGFYLQAVHFLTFIEVCLFHLPMCWCCLI